LASPWFPVAARAFSLPIRCLSSGPDVVPDAASLASQEQGSDRGYGSAKARSEPVSPWRIEVHIAREREYLANEEAHSGSGFTQGSTE